MPDKRLTRANTQPGSPERKEVYAREYAARQARANQEDLSYYRVRNLRALFPLSEKSKAELKRNKKDVSKAHTRYAIIRAQQAQAEIQTGKSVSARQARGAKILNEPLGNVNPNAEIANWYRQAWGSDYRPQDFGVAAQPTQNGAGLAGYAFEHEPEELYDVEWENLDEWDVWEQVRKFQTP